MTVISFLSSANWIYTLFSSNLYEHTFARSEFQTCKIVENLQITKEFVGDFGHGMTI